MEIKIDELPHSFNKLKFINENFDKKNIEICFLYKSFFSNSKILRDFVDLIFSKLNISSEWKIRLVLIVDEMNNNAVEYWSLQWEMNSLNIKILNKKDSIYINFEVQDTGHWLKSKKSYIMHKLEEESMYNSSDNKRSIRWRWLFVIIKKLVDHLYFKDSDSWWLIVGIEKTLKK